MENLVAAGTVTVIGLLFLFRKYKFTRQQVPTFETYRAYKILLNQITYAPTRTELSNIDESLISFYIDHCKKNNVFANWCYQKLNTAYYARKKALMPKAYLAIFLIVVMFFGSCVPAQKWAGSGCYATRQMVGYK